MTVQVENDEEMQRVTMVIGACLMAWAQVEFALITAFRHLRVADGITIDSIFSKVRNFDTKVILLGDMACRTLSENYQTDWRLIREHTMVQYGNRNKIAHGTLVQWPKDGVVLEPFMVPSTTKPKKLKMSDILDYTEVFQELHKTIDWFAMSASGKQPPQSPEQEPDLIRRLREKDDRNREAQRHRAEAWRQYLDRNPDLKP